MSFTNLWTRQKLEPEKVARFVVSHGKRRFLIRTSLSVGIVSWLGVWLLLLARGYAGSKGDFWIGGEIAILLMTAFFSLLLSMFFGFVISLRLWNRFERLAKSDQHS